MNYTLITQNGKILMFYVQAAAEIYRKAYGGVILNLVVYEENNTEEIFDSLEAEGKVQEKQQSMDLT